MRIDNSGIIASLIQGSKEGQQGQQQAASQSDSPSGKQSDKVTLTNTASQLQYAEVAMESRPVVDTQRVEKIQSAINDGKLNINAAQIADKMLSLERALNSARAGA